MPDHKTYEPPKWAMRFLSWFCKDELLEEVEGDLFEHYQELRTRHSKLRATIVYWFHVVHFLRPFALKKIGQNSNTIIMYRSYFKFAFRNLFKHKLNAGFNILSLGVGMACFIFIAIYISGELSYDKFHNGSDRIERVIIDIVNSDGQRIEDATTPPALAVALKNDLPEVEHSVRLFPSWGTKLLLGTSPENRSNEEAVIRTDSTFFDVFSFPLKYGNRDEALKSPTGIVLTQSAAIKHFGKEDVLGEELKLYGDGRETPLQVTGVLYDIPENSHFHFDYLARITFNNIDQNWGWYNYYTYVKLVEGTDIGAFKAKLPEFYANNIDPEARQARNVIYSQALTDIHLKSNIKWELEANGSMINVYIFTALGLFVLLISSINFLNLTVASSLQRIKEVGVRKVFGAHRKSLVSQFIIEALVTVLLALALGSFIAELLFRSMGDVLGKQISILDAAFIGPYLKISAATLLFGILAGLYPAVFLSSFQVSNAVKGVFRRSGKSVLGLRKSLLVVQFAIAAFMLFGSMVVYQQLEFVKNKDLGFDNDQMLVVQNLNSVGSLETLENEISSVPNVRSLGASSGVLGGLNWTFTVGYPDGFLMNYMVCKPEYLETVGFEFVAGRNFSKDRPTDTQGLNIIVNETAMEALGFSHEDIGRPMPMSQNGDSIENGTVIGVVKDFVFTDLKQEVKPYAFFYRNEDLQNLYIKLETNDISNSISAIQEKWEKVAGNLPFEYFFLDETYQQHHEKETKLSQIFLYLTILAIFIAFVGMVAMTNITIKDRLKEIAIRKVLGATSSSVTRMITVKFLILVLVANIIAIPAGYLLMNNWLSEFAYRTELNAFIFIIGMIITLALAWLIVSAQSMKAAISNPVKSLRSE